MRRTLIAILLTIVASVATAQKTIDWPSVEESPSNSGMTLTISRVATGEYTAVFIEAIISPQCNGCWISLASKTYLTVAGNYSSHRIIDWGLFENNEPQSLKFDKQYSVTPDRRYLLYMVFPSIPDESRIISIKEQVDSWDEEGFYWKNIRIDRSGSKSSVPATQQRSPYSAPDFSPSGSGTCFAISSDGFLATCHHVVSDGGRLRIRGVNGDFNKTYNAVVVATDKNNDLAIVRIDDPDFTSIETPPYTISATQSDVGDKVYVLGYPLRAYMGDEIKLTDGLISSRTGFQGDATSYQISAAVQPGNSGCPLFDEKGNIIGVVNARLAVESAAYSVKSAYLLTLTSSLDHTPDLPRNNTVSTLSLSEKIKRLKKFIYIIEVE